MTRRALILALLALAALPLAQGCRKPAPPPSVSAKPSPTPMALSDTLAFTRLGALWMARGDGSDQRLLASPGRGQSFWMPCGAADGGVLAWLSKADGTQDLVHVGLDGRLTALTDIGETAAPPMKSSRLGNAPSVSPDGKSIAYSFNGDLWVMDANGYNAVTLISDGASWAPSFSPDGKHLAYVNGSDGHYDLWVSDLDSRDTYQVSDFEGYTVGRPQWAVNGQRILVTRIRGDESDLVQVLASTDTPLADADVITRDHLSASAVFSTDGTHLLFGSARADSQAWDLYVSDATGAGAKPLTHDGGMNPCWVKAIAPAGLAVAAVAPAKPAAMAAPTPAAAPVPAPVVAAKPAFAPATATAHGLAPQGGPGAQAPSATAPKSPGAVTATSKAPSLAPGNGARPATSTLPVPRVAALTAASPAQPAAGNAPKPAGPAAATSLATPAPAPTQPPLKASPLRLRYRASFDAKDHLTLAALTELKKLSRRVQQYDGEEVKVFGPLDPSPLKGRYSSAELRSKARAQAVAAQIRKQAQLDDARVKALPYSPPAGSGAPNSIQIYVELK